MTATTASLTERAQSFGHLFVDRVEQDTRQRGLPLPGRGLVDVADLGADQGAGVRRGRRPGRPRRAAAAAGCDRVARPASSGSSPISAILCAGAATTTVYPTTAAADVAYILSDSQSVVVFAENAEQTAKVQEAELPDLMAIVQFDGSPEPADGGAPVITFDELVDRGKELLAERAGRRRRADRRHCGPEDLATLIYTSGTTGRPKGVRLVHDNWTYEGSAVAALGILGPRRRAVPLAAAVPRARQGAVRGPARARLQHRGRRRPDARSWRTWA